MSARMKFRPIITVLILSVCAACGSNDGSVPDPKRDEFKVEVVPSKLPEPVTEPTPPKIQFIESKAALIENDSDSPVVILTAKRIGAKTTAIRLANKSDKAIKEISISIGPPSDCPKMMYIADIIVDRPSELRAGQEASVELDDETASFLRPGPFESTCRETKNRKAVISVYEVKFLDETPWGRQSRTDDSK